MSELRELYQQVILDHNRKPRNFRKLEGANRTAEGYNPLCGDQITLYLDVQDGVIKDAAFQGSGCAISRAAASMMTASVVGKREADAKALFERVHAMLAGETNGDGARELGKLAVFGGVREFPSRIKCATLAWHTLVAALSGAAHPVSTEGSGGPEMAPTPPVARTRPGGPGTRRLDAASGASGGPEMAPTPRGRARVPWNPGPGSGGVGGEG
jgi:nitrogen fixation protein NifU and related proteins